MGAVRDLTDLVQEAIDRGASTVEDIHREIADLPLKALEDVRFLEKPIQEIRRVQDRSIGAVYDLIRNINRRAGKLAQEMLAGGAKKPARKTAARKSAARRRS